MSQDSPVPELKGEDFYNETMGTTEEATCYIPGGYHPAILGNILGESPQRRYRLMHKLGWGSYATVWLAQTTDNPNTFVAVKITTGEDEDTQMQEVEMLQKATKAQPDDSSDSRAIKLLDHFKLHGPNGSHTVIVTDVVVPILSLRPSKQPPAWRKAAVYGIAQAMAQLHASQIVHGDWHLGNIGIAMPQLANQDPEDVMRGVGQHDVTVVLTEDPTKQTPSLPAYLISPCDISKYYQKIAGSDAPQIKVYDFGTAHEFGTHPLMYQCALEACAPEVVRAQIFEKIDNPALDQRADVWALGATILEIVAGAVLFYGVGMRGLPYCMSELAGRIPSHWENWSASLSDPITQADAEKWWAERWRMIRAGCENDEDAQALVRLLKTVLVLDPAERPTAAQIVDDPWFQSATSAKVTAPV